ncbi:MAG: hypothetical protein AAF196_17810 [Planctomycetota bacterium]
MTLPRLETILTGIRHLAIASIGAVAMAQEATVVEAPETGFSDTFFPENGLHFRCVGPTRGGRVTTVAGIRQRVGHYYAGATGGGVYKTEDHGTSWRNVSDGFFSSPSIGAIRVAPSDPDRIYVGTGSDGLRSNVITGCGVYRSDDAGGSWEFLGLPKSGHIGAVEVHPENPDLVFVAAIGQAFGPNPERGLYRSRDGGRSWAKVLGISDRTGVCDVEFHPSDPNTIYATAWQAERKPWTILSGGEEGGVFRSTDGGSTFTQLKTGLPEGLVGKADLAVSQANPDRVYVLIEAPEDRGGVYVSQDRGDSFTQVNSDRGPRVRPFYYTNIDANPADADEVYVSATGFYRSTDGAKSFRRASTPHGDNHELWIHPDQPQFRVQANDGGANCTIDGGSTWSTQRNQATAELYQVHVDDRFPYWLYAGQQDNSTIRVPSQAPYSHPAGPQGFWESVGGCETGPAVPKPGEPHIVFAACKGRFGVFDARTGQERRYDVTAANMYGHNPKDLADRFQRVSPIHVSPHDPNTVYHASQYLYRTRDSGRTWTRISPDLTAFEPDKQVISGSPITRDITGEEFYSTLYAVQESPIERDELWAGANDGPIHLSRDGGQSWNDVTPTLLPPGGRVQTIEVSPHQRGKAFACVLRYQLGDWTPWLLRTTDFGESWVHMSTEERGFPTNAPVRVVREDPEREGLLYCGTEWGLFVSFDDGEHWQSLQAELPVTPITDMKVHQGDLVLSTMGRSFWIADDLSPLRQWDDELRESALSLARPRAAIRTRLPRRRGIPRYLGAGATLDYWLATPAEETVVEMEILDASGRVVRRFRSDGDGERAVAPSEPAMHEEQMVLAGTPRLPTERGWNRFVWNLRYPGPWSVNGGGRSGPMVLPGRYLVRVRVGEQTDEAYLEVRLDPRLEATDVSIQDLEQQLETTRRLDELIGRARELQDRTVEGLRTAELTSDDRETLTSVRDALETSAGTYQQPKLLDQLGYLREVLQSADQAPGQDAIERLAELQTAVQGLQDEADSALPSPRNGESSAGNRVEALSRAR